MRRVNYQYLSSTVALAMSLGAPSASAGEFAELSRFLPSDANAIIVVNAEAMYESPLGKRENWRQKFSDASESTPMLLPPTAQRCILASQLDIDSLRPDWEAAAMTLSIDPTIQQVAQRRNGLVDAVGSFEAVWLANDTAILKFAPRTFGVLTPATRQEAHRWAVDVASPEIEPLSAYLQQALSYADSVGTEIILAVDLAGALPMASLRARAIDSVMLDSLPEAETVKLLTGVQGVKLGVLVRDKLQGRLQIDFADDTASLASVAKPLILAILGESGAMLDEFNAWTAEAKGKSLAISGELTADGLRRILSLLAVDASAVEQHETPPAPPAPPASTGAAPAKPDAAPVDAAKTAMIRASQRYFRAVGKYVEDAQRLNRADSLRQSVMWLENYARRIQNLPTRGVDPDLVKYGQYVAQTFGYVVGQAYGIENTQDAIAATEGPSEVRVGLLPTGRTVNWGNYYYEREYAPYGWATYNKQEQEQSADKRQKLIDQIYKSVEEARQTLTQLVADQETIRSSLSQRYGVPF